MTENHVLKLLVANLSARCLLLGVKRTFLTCSLMSAFDPKRTLRVPCMPAARGRGGYNDLKILLSRFASNCLADADGDSHMGNTALETMQHLTGRRVQGAGTGHWEC